MRDLLPEPPNTLLPADPAESLEGLTPEELAARFPTSSAAWADLAERAFADDRVVTAYAYARTGYHRGLDQLRRNGWKGSGPVPWAHRPNRGFLRCVDSPARAAAAIGETEEDARCRQLLVDCDSTLSNGLPSD